MRFFKPLVVVFLLLCLLVQVTAVFCSSMIWSRSYGSEEGDYARSVIETSDGGFMLAGITRDDYGFDVKILLIKTDVDGNLEWNKTIEGVDSYYANSLIQANDGGYVIAGDRYVINKGYDGWLTKIDVNGNMQWNRTFGGTNPDHVHSVIQTLDGGYALACDTQSFGAGGYDGWLIKTDSDGNIQWNQTFGGVNHEIFYSIIYTSDYGFALAGTAYESPFENRSSWLVKTDGYGNLEWNKTYGGERLDVAHSLVEASDNGYVVAGNQIVKTDKDGNMQWSKTFDSFSARSIIKTSDERFVLTGGNQAIKIDLLGNLMWNQTYGRTNYEQFTSLVETSDGGLVLAGYSGSLNVTGKTNFLLVKTDPQGIPEFSSSIIFPLLVGSTIIVLICRKTLKKKPVF